MSSSKTIPSLWLSLMLMALVFLYLPGASLAKGTYDANSTEPLHKSAIFKDQGIVIPFNYDRLLCPMPVVMVRLNGSKPMPFVIDTGFSGPVILETWVVDKLHLRYREGTIQLSPRVNRPYKCVEINQLALVDAENEDRLGIAVDTAIVDDDNTNTRIHGKNLGIAGTIGAPLLSQLVVQFDYPAREIRMLKAEEYVLPEAASIHTLPMSEGSRGEWYISVPAASKQGVKFHIDTGSSITCLNEKTLPLLDRETILFTDTTELSNAAGVHPTEGVLLESLNIAGFPIRNVYTPIRRNGEYCLLGNDILSLFLVTLDFPHRRVVFEPYKTINRPDGNDAGLLVREIAEPFVNVEMAPDGTFTVTAVTDEYQQKHLKGSRIEVGDTVYSVNGFPLLGLSVLSAQDLLQGAANTTSNIVLRRKEEWLAVDHFCEGYFGLSHGGFVSATTMQDGTTVIKYKDGTQRVEDYIIPSIENVVPPPHAPQIGYDWIWYPNSGNIDYWAAVPASVIKSVVPPPGAPYSGHYWKWLVNPHPKSGQETGLWVMVSNNYVPDPKKTLPPTISAPPHGSIPGYEWVWYSRAKWTGVWALIPKSAPGHNLVLGPSAERMRLQIAQISPMSHDADPNHYQVLVPIFAS